MSDEGLSTAHQKQQCIPIAGIGASAGGLEAISHLLRALPADTGIGFVIVQHLAPDHESLLVDILGRVASMPVVEATDGRAVEPNRVYVIPPNADLEISHGVLHLKPRTTGFGLHLPIDQFLTSLAEDCKERSIGIILSGTASDGTLGFKAIKAAGGITFAQDEVSAKYGSMPQHAIAAGYVDFILPPQKIAQELVRIKLHPYVAREPLTEDEGAQAISEKYLNTIFSVLKIATGVDFSNYREPTVIRRVRRRMAVHNLETIASYINFLQQTMGEPQALYNDLLINVTGFFRDPEIFEVLQKKAFPQLLAAGETRASIRIWVPGCSTGEEAYSIAMCLSEYLAGIKSACGIQIFATDISDVALEVARTGIYTQSEVVDVSSDRLKRFFSEVAQGFQINKTIREMCVFAKQNLIKDPPFSKIDLISCRNLLIYLKPSLHKRLMPIFHYALQPHGFLLLGKSESAMGVSDLFGIVDKRHKIYFKKYAPSGTRPEFGVGQPLSALQDSKARVASRLIRDFDPQKEANRLLLSEFTPAGLLLNSNLEIIHFHGHTGPYLDPVPGAASLRLLKMAREGLPLELHSAIQQAETVGKPVVKSGIRVASGEGIREITIEVRPIKSPAGDRFYLVLFREGGAPQPGQESTYSAQDREVVGLRGELEQVNAQLHEIIEHNEENEQELRVANEEVQSTNEELQSTNEELETAKEELQATNEELTTLNEELQNRNIELGQSNDDLLNIISNLTVPMVILGRDLRIRRFTPSAADILKLIPGDVGRPVTDLSAALDFDGFGNMVFDAIHSESMKSRDVKDRHGKWHSLRIRPYSTAAGKIEGAVITFIDIHELKLEMAESQRYAEAIVATIRESILLLDAELRVKAVNESFLERFRVSREETENRQIYDLGGGAWNIPRLLSLLREILPKQTEIKDFEVAHDFPKLGRRVMSLNARQIKRADNRPDWILLAIEDVTERKRSQRA